MSEDTSGWAMVFLTFSIAFMVVWSALRGEMGQAIDFAELGAVVNIGLAALMVCVPHAERLGEYIGDWYRGRKGPEAEA